MEKQLEKLIRLAVLDHEIRIVRKSLEAVPKAVEKLRGRYRAAEDELEGAREELSSVQKEHRRAEGELDAHLEKIRKLNDQTAMVKTNKEYQAILAEIENLKKEQDSYEEKILELMEQSAEIEKKIKLVELDVKREKDVFEKDEERLRAEAEALQYKLNEVEQERAGILPGIESENLHLYSRVKALRGDAVAELKDEICLGCRVSVPPQKYADVVMSETIQTCSHCQRILFHRREVQVKPSEAEAQ